MKNVNIEHGYLLIRGTMWWSAVFQVLFILGHMFTVTLHFSAQLPVRTCVGMFVSFNVESTCWMLDGSQDHLHVDRGNQ